MVDLTPAVFKTVCSARQCAVARASPLLNGVDKATRCSPGGERSTWLGLGCAWDRRVSRSGDAARLASPDLDAFVVVAVLGHGFELVWAATRRTHVLRL